jgi:hypothetical protein
MVGTDEVELRHNVITLNFMWADYRHNSTCILICNSITHFTMTHRTIANF